MIVEDDKQVENCAKIFAKSKQFKANKELYRENLDNLKKLINECAILSKNTSELLNNKDNSDKYDKYVVFDDSQSIEYLNLNDDVIGWSKGISRTNKKPANRHSKNSHKSHKLSVRAEN